MSWTKRELIQQAFDEIGFANYVYDLNPAQLQSALRTLDSMLASWYARGIALGYPISSSPGTADLDQDSNAPDWANEAIYLSLAARLGPRFGKTITPETKIAAKQAYDAMLQRTITLIEMQLPDTMPVGAGNKPWRTADNPFTLPPDLDPLRINEGGELDFLDA
jgi:hypothetical protein